MGFTGAGDEGQRGVGGGTSQNNPGRENCRASCGLTGDGCPGLCEVHV